MFKLYRKLLYYASLNQRKTGKTGKSVKGFEKLTKKYPDKCVYHMELAYSYLERGYGNKAYEAFCKAYEMGARDLEFLKLFSICCENRCYYEHGYQLLLEQNRLGISNIKKNREELLDGFRGMLVFCIALRKSIKEILEAFLDFVQKSALSVSTDEESYLQILAVLYAGLDNKDEKEHQLFERVKKELNNILGKKFDKLWRLYATGVELSRLRSDWELPEYLTATICQMMTSSEEEIVKKYAETDMELLILEEWPGNRELFKKFAADYPFSYKVIKDFIEQLDTAYNSGRISILRDKLLKKYDQFDLSCEGGLYYQKYPENKRNREVSVWDSEADGSYVRTTKKIGRNDACPCGSGKKYKNCCGRK